MDERTKEAFEALPPEKRAKAAAAMAKRRTPEYQTKELANRIAYDREFAATGTIATQSDPTAILLSDAQSLEIAAQLKAARESSGLSVDRVAEISGLDRSAVFKLERGENPNPTLRTLNRYASAFGAKIEFVIRLPDDEVVR